MNWIELNLIELIWFHFGVGESDGVGEGNGDIVGAGNGDIVCEGDGDIVDVGFDVDVGVVYVVRVSLN